MTIPSDKKKQIDKLQSQYDQNPGSQVFAALAELYRESGQLKLAEKIAREGVKKHQRFATGILVYGRIMKDLGQLDQAEIYLKKSIQLAPESILGHQLCGELFLQLKKPKDALKAYKMVLLLKPNSVSARRAVNRLESLTADEYDDETFQISKLSALKNSPMPSEVLASSSAEHNHFSNRSESINSRPQSSQEKFESEFKNANERAVDRVLSLVDAFIVRNDLKKAMELLTEAENEFDKHLEIEKRKQLILRSQNIHLNETDDSSVVNSSSNSSSRRGGKPTDESKLSRRMDLINSKKLHTLDTLLQRVEAYRQEHIRL